MVVVEWCVLGSFRRCASGLCWTALSLVFVQWVSFIVFVCGVDSEHYSLSSTRACAEAFRRQYMLRPLYSSILLLACCMWTWCKCLATTGCMLTRRLRRLVKRYIHADHSSSNLWCCCHCTTSLLCIVRKLICFRLLLYWLDHKVNG